MDSNRTSPFSFRRPQRPSLLKKISLLALIGAFAGSFTYGSMRAIKYNAVPQKMQELASTAVSNMPTLTAEVLNLDNKRVVRLMQQVDMNIAETIQQQIIDLNAEDAKTPIVLLIESPGGDVMAGGKILDAIKMSKAPIHAQIVGICASMAAIIAVHCDKIYMTQGSWLLWHNASLQTGGDIRMVKEWMEFFLKRMEEINRSTAERLHISYEEYLKRINMVWLMTADEAVKKGIADGYITQVLCRKGADGCKEKLYKPREERFFPF